MALAPPVKADGGALVVDGSTDSVAEVVAGADAGALALVTAASELVGAGAAPVGRVMVTPPERQKDCAYASVAGEKRRCQLRTKTRGAHKWNDIPCWSSALQAVVMQAWTPSRKLVAEQIHAASVTEHPVLPMAVRAQLVYALMSVGGVLVQIEDGGEEDIRHMLAKSVLVLPTSGAATKDPGWWQ